ncbi:PLP-dependent aspartate aminotransferase family protein [Paracoccus sp. J39]|uniref:trans-sulfuration enzyme family protein n=1 Tax=Paracoccus sp. J39 TaxID=935848 RepID=UPI000491F3A1|nr:PLP-dependent transferase [Paracoccus sp. J39]
MRDQTCCVKVPAISEDGFASLAIATHRASTIPFPDATAYQNRASRAPDGYSYGLAGTPTTRALEAQISALEGGARTALLPSGQGAVMIAILALLSRGEQLLLPDSVYPPARQLAVQDLARYGIETSFYDPCSITDLASKITPATRMVWIESPGSTTMEVQDFRAIADLAHTNRALVGCDNTWATPLNFKPIQHGADLVVEALTKYFAGHSDVLMGSITTADGQVGVRIKQTMSRFGLGVSPDDCALVLRGIQTMHVRLRHVAAVSLRLAEWLARQPVVTQVLHPALPGAPGHELWRRDFLGASGVFSLVLKPEAAAHLNPALDKLRTFAIGASWGGTHSLLAPMDVATSRSLPRPGAPTTYLRVSIGLEAEEDLLADLETLCAELTRRTSAETEAG